MSQMKLAEEADVSYDTIKRIESGNHGMTLDSFINIAAALKVDPSLLFQREEEKKSEMEQFYALLGERSKSEKEYLFFMMEKMVEGLSMMSN